MALQTFEERVLNYCGEGLDGDVSITRLMINDWVNQGVRVIVGRLPDSLLPLISQRSLAFAPTTGYVFTSGRILSVLRQDSGGVGRKCVEISFNELESVQDVNSMRYPTELFPKFVIKPQTDSTRKVIIYPLSDSPIGYIVLLVIPEITVSSATAIKGVPDELEHLSVLYAVSQAKYREAGLMRRKSQYEMESTTGSAKDLPTFTLPTAPSMPTLSVTASLTAMTNAIPTYRNIDFTGISFSDSIADVSPPSFVSPSSYKFTATNTEDALTKAQNLIDNLGPIDFEAYISNDDVEQAQAVVQAAAQEVNRAGAEISKENIKLNEYRTELEEKLGQFNGEISNYQAQVGEEINRFQANLKRYETDVQKAIQIYASENELDVQMFRAEFEKVLQTYRAENETAIQEFQANVQKEIENYQALVNGEVAEMQAGVAKASVRLQNTQSFDQKGVAAMNEALVFQKQFNDELNGYIGNAKTIA